MQKQSLVFLMVMVIVAIGLVPGCIHANTPLQESTETVHSTMSDVDFFLAMSKGYETSFPDQEDVLMSKGYCEVQGEKCAIFCWRDPQGRLSAVINAFVKFPGNDEIVAVNTSEIGKEWTGKEIWITDQKAVTFTFISMGKLIDDNEANMFKRIKRLERDGLGRIDMLLPQR